jgi:hypothetical protein
VFNDLINLIQAGHKGLAVLIVKVVLEYCSANGGNIDF